MRSKLARAVNAAPYFLHESRVVNEKCLHPGMPILAQHEAICSALFLTIPTGFNPYQWLGEADRKNITREP